MNDPLVDLPTRPASRWQWSRRQRLAERAGRGAHDDISIPSETKGKMKQITARTKAGSIEKAEKQDCFIFYQLPIVTLCSREENAGGRAGSLTVFWGRRGRAWTCPGGIRNVSN